MQPDPCAPPETFQGWRCFRRCGEGEQRLGLVITPGTHKYSPAASIGQLCREKMPRSPPARVQRGTR